MVNCTVFGCSCLYLQFAFLKNIRRHYTANSRLQIRNGSCNFRSINVAKWGQASFFCMNFAERSAFRFTSFPGFHHEALDLHQSHWSQSLRRDPKRDNRVDPPYYGKLRPNQPNCSFQIEIRIRLTIKRSHYNGFWMSWFFRRVLVPKYQTGQFCRTLGRSILVDSSVLGNSQSLCL